MQKDFFDDSKENVAADPIEPPWTSTPRCGRSVGVGRSGTRRGGAERGGAMAALRAGAAVAQHPSASKDLIQDAECQLQPSDVGL